MPQPPNHTPQPVPQEYRIAIDALLTFTQPAQCGVLCESAELRSLLPFGFARVRSLQSDLNTVIWVEPQRDTWRRRLRPFIQAQRLIIIASRPLAACLPERVGWADRPLGITQFGLYRLRHKLKQMGWRVTTAYGFHTVASMLINRCAAQLDRFGQYARADRWRFSARLRYTNTATRFSTVSLLICQPTIDSI